MQQGDLFAPVEGERFELVVANPPFVISPSRRYIFRDSELPVDELCRMLVRSAPEHLADGGHCQLLASWAHVAGEDWRDRLRGWFEDTGCDALVLEREVLEPSAHAASWLRQTEPPDQWQPEYDEWMAYYERHRIEAVGFGLITMRKRVRRAILGFVPKSRHKTGRCRAGIISVRSSNWPTSSTATEADDCSTWRCGSRPTWSSTSEPGQDLRDGE